MPGALAPRDPVFDAWQRRRLRHKRAHFVGSLRQLGDRLVAESALAPADLAELTALAERIVATRNAADDAAARGAVADRADFDL